MFGVITSEHPLTSVTGTKILMNGGNAFDATIATSFTLAVNPTTFRWTWRLFFALLTLLTKVKFTVLIQVAGLQES